MPKIKRIKFHRCQYKNFIGEYYFDKGIEMYLGKVIGIPSLVTFSGECKWDTEISFQESVNDYLSSLNKN